MNSVAEDVLLEPFDRERLAYLAGPLDANLRQVEQRLGVTLSYNGALFHIEGVPRQVKLASRLLKSLYLETAPLRGKKPEPLGPGRVHLAIIENTGVEQDDLGGEPDGPRRRAASFRTRRGFVKARTPNQADYIQKIGSKDICFGVGPAGTGKTYLAVAAAVEALERGEARRLVLTRPAVEAGEKLGFLPGDLSQKVDPYLRPLYDALFEMLGFERVEKLIERQVIEIAPLAYMRGRTLNDAFIILDEAQNTTIEQMKMFLTRIGFNSRAVVTGDPSQTDLPRHVRSGLRHAVSVLGDLKEIGFTFFGAADVVRHPLVALIVSAYERHERDGAPDRAGGSGEARDES